MIGFKMSDVEVCPIKLAVRNCRSVVSRYPMIGTVTSHVIETPTLSKEIAI